LQGQRAEIDSSQALPREAHIAGYGTSLPYRVSTARFLDVDEEARRRHGQGEGTRSMVRQFAENSGIRFRHCVSPCWLPEDERPDDVEDIFTPADFDPPGWQRALAWQEQAPKLAIQAARAAIANWGGSPSDITHVVTTSTSGWAEPGISSALIHCLGLSLDTQKQELNFNGCFCGATCLRVARDMVRAGDARAVLVVAVEVASVQYDPLATDMSSLVATILFADGAAAFILAPEGDWVYEGTGMSLVPGTREMLRMSPDLVGDRPTYRMFLHREIGSRLATYFREERGALLLSQLLDRSRGVPPALAVHPGGPSILESVREVFDEKGWPPEAMQPSIDTLYNTGNLGAAAMLFVMARLLPKLKAERLATFAFGPGVTVEWGLLRRKERHHSYPAPRE
jgi:predicted naringenin-chalcone synthase